MIKNIEKINEIKRVEVEKIAKYIEETDTKNIIDKVIVFGSSVREDCTTESDIDICIISKYDSKNPLFFEIFGTIPMIIDSECDLLNFKYISAELKNNILTTGVIIYE